MQSPDEPDHTKRAYAFAHGTLVLKTSNNSASGAMIDTGILQYIKAFQPISSVQKSTLSKERKAYATTINWSHEQEFNTTPGTGYYFPLIYAPQAVAWRTGEFLDLPIQTTYYFSRYLTLLVSICILAVAMHIYPTNILTVVLISLPMSLFQLSTQTIDGMATVLSLLGISIFMRIHQDRKKAHAALFPVLVLCLFTVTTSRIHLLPLLILPYMCAQYLGQRKYLIQATVLTLLVIVWYVIAIATTVDLRIEKGNTTNHILFFYLANPMAFFEVLLRTVFDTASFNNYRRMFIGILGWLDTPFPRGTYNALSIAILMLTVASISMTRIRQAWRTSALLILCYIASVVLMYFALLVSWTPHPAIKIQGVQGRYFLIPAMLFAYAVSDKITFPKNARQRIAYILAGCLVVFSVTQTPPLLLDRYFIASDKQPPFIHSP